jgi:integrase
MSHLKFTEKSVAKLPAPHPSGQQVFFWDLSFAGFGVLLSGTSKAKTYVVKSHGVRRKIGRADVMPLADARAAAKKMMAGLALGIDPKRKQFGDATLRMVLDGYIEGTRLKPRTQANYREGIERHLTNWLDKPVNAISREMVETRHRQIAEEVAERERKNIADQAKAHLKRAERTELDYPEASARHRMLHQAAVIRQPRSGRGVADGVMRVLRALMNYAIDKDASLGVNPVRLRRMWYKPPRRERLVKADDMQKFYAAVLALENPVQRDYLLLLLFSGLRRREAAALTWEDVDFKAGIIRVPSSSTKNSKPLNLPMSDVVRDLMIARRKIGKTEYVFPANSMSGGVTHLQEPKFALAEVAAACGVKICAHDLRRTYISVAESCDISPIAMKCLVNHALGGDVTAGYAILSTERLREAAQRIADRLRELCCINEPKGKNIEKLRGKSAV